MILRLSVVIPVHELSGNQRSLLLSCLRQNLPSDEFEVIFVFFRKTSSWMPTDESKYKVRCISTDEENVSKARNIGMQQAIGEYVLFLDDDVILPRESFFEEALKILMSEGSPCIVGGGYLDSPQAPWLTAVSNTIANLWIRAGLMSSESNGLYTAKFLVGGVLAARKAAIEKIPFPEDVPWGGEDSIFLKKAQSLNINTKYSNSLDVTHNGSSSLRKFIHRAWQGGKVQALHQVDSALFKNKFFVILGCLSKKVAIQFPLLCLHFFVVVAAKYFYLFLKHIPASMKKQFRLKIRTTE